ncbi:hypothetical protein [Arcanobacterium hippocoleae]|uniref:YtxH domain-containing protein n=1 Tax=Arcanobacterium hippocoleae TaxID=149017 RepID=A0ABU1T3S2_9ACTO|nr:hypothetical protein [Arcanobacterium hippocoleae]MDR6939511.1 hypothetical protein [Arcanobacterium hippocoleae]
MAFLRTVTVLGLGYVLGARAGRERYEQIKKQAKKLWNSAPVQKGRKKAKETASQTFQRATDAAIANAKGAAASVKDAAFGSAESVANAKTPMADEIIVEPIEDFRERR